MSQKKIILSLFLLVVTLVFEVLVSGPIGVLGALLDIVLIGTLATLLSRVFIRRAPFRDVLQRNIIFTSNVFGVFTLIIALALVAINSFPTSLSEVSLTDGKKKVVFMQMSHIATPRYYDTVRDRLSELSREGYAIYREGVLPGSRENQDRFDALLGMKIHSGTYDEIARLIDLEAQTDRIYDGVASGSLSSVDLSIDEIMSLIPPSTTSGEVTIIDPTIELTRITETSRGPLLSYFARALLNLSLRYTHLSDSILDTLDPSLRQAILDRRNTHIVDTLLASPPDQHIVIVYGALHFDGVYTLLQSRDPNWKVTSITPYFPYQP